jgi:hypothetical protein
MYFKKTKKTILYFSRLLKIFLKKVVGKCMHDLQVLTEKYGISQIFLEIVNPDP